VSIVVAIQARAGSTRLPGKVLMDLGGRPMLAYQLTRLAPLREHVDAVVVATSDLPRDDAVAAVATDAGATVVRGPEADVLGRFGALLAAAPADTIVRLTGDCPLADPALVLEVVARHHESGADYTSNVFPRTFPRGLDVEVVRRSALECALAEASEPAEREHVMPFLYRRPDRFVLAAVESGGDFGHARWVVDTAADLDAVREMVQHFAPRVHMSWREILAAFPVGTVPVPDGTGLTLRRAGAADRDYLFDLRNDPECIRTSGTGRAVGRAEHDEWFDRVISSPSSRLSIIDDRSGVVGQIRIDVHDGLGDVSIAVGPEHRGRGLATRALAALQDSLRGDPQVVGLRALIRSDHGISRSVFTARGFVTVGEQEGMIVQEWLQVDSPDRRGQEG